jgi:PAS domain S-box-containing protein
MPQSPPGVGLAEAEAIAPFGVWEWDVTRNTVRWSEGLYAIYGLRREDFPATYEGYIARVHPDDRARVHNAVQQAYRAQAPFEFEERVVRPNGEVRWLVSRGRVDCDARGQPIRMTGVCQDVTALKEAAAALEARANTLARSNEDLEQFAQTAVQQLQEPLRALENCAQQLGKPGASAGEGSRVLRDSVLRMQDFVAALLAYSRAGQSFAPPAALDLADALDGALASLAAKVREAGAQVTRDPLPRVTVDSAQLEDVFARLLDNALRHRGAAPPRIHVGAARAGGYWVVSVRDNGGGIDPSQLERVFVPFARASAARQAPGTGMSLAVCRRIVARHGGRIWASSEGAGKGATISFTLPETPAA